MRPLYTISILLVAARCRRWNRWDAQGTADTDTGSDSPAENMGQTGVEICYIQPISRGHAVPENPADNSAGRFNKSSRSLPNAGHVPVDAGVSRG